MAEKRQNNCANQNCKADRCKVCGKERKSNAMKDHIEGIVIPCNLCDKTFRSRNGFRLHRRHNKNYLICEFFFIFFSL